MTNPSGLHDDLIERARRTADGERLLFIDRGCSTLLDDLASALQTLVGERDEARAEIERLKQHMELARLRINELEML